MLKKYCERGAVASQVNVEKTVVPCAAALPMEQEDVFVAAKSVPVRRLCNSELLANFESHLSQLSSSERTE